MVAHKLQEPLAGVRLLASGVLAFYTSREIRWTVSFLVMLISKGSIQIYVCLYLNKEELGCKRWFVVGCALLEKRRLFRRDRRCDSPTETAQLFCPYSLQCFKEYTACVEGGCGNSCFEFGLGSSLQRPTVLDEKPGANSSLSNFAIVLCYSSAPEIFIN